MTRELFLTEFADALQLSRGSVTMSDVLRDLPQWDSMKILDLVFMLERKGGVTIKLGDAASWRTVADIARLAGVADA